MFALTDPSRPVVGSSCSLESEAPARCGVTIAAGTTNGCIGGCGEIYLSKVGVVS
jgi:hypothetical protein